MLYSRLLPNTLSRNQAFYMKCKTGNKSQLSSVGSFCKRALSNLFLEN
ncbi:hypothetical protein GNIT_3288 [Glaciecola nitratireducens FR1064]|uniref:Uncharacterized protein n=1 Tax=Glaciecola nitratireducens (strain JCM 12485 / KCTC 12276 / FR1064) TaxID=1085623 RepID=G4QEA7_GLANF|nr:hypothetical protein GNIT_3288 [Glaciecola nitratireducens FR1064]